MIIHSLIIKDRHDLGNGVFNVGSGKSMSVGDMANLTQYRCEKLLDKEVLLTKPGFKGNNKELYYVVQKLKDTGVDYEIDHINEIDCLIDFCIKHFS